MRKILITGTNRGIGLALTQASLAAGDHVFAASRNPADSDALTQLRADYGERLTLIPLDVRDTPAITAAHDIVAAHTDTLDILINNAGIMREDHSITTLSADEMTENFAVNVLAPALIAQQFVGLLQRGTTPVIVNMSSSYASIGLKSERMSLRYSYSVSKAALNMLSKTLALELKPMGITVLALHPGWVQTDLGGANARLTPAESAAALLQVIGGATLEDTGKYLSWEGKEIPW